MRCQRFVAAVLAGLCLATGPAAAFTGPVQDAAALAKRIDRLIEARWAAAQFKPAARADDAEFIRRVYLDLTGRIPAVIDARDFLDDDRPDKRRIWVEKLLASERYAHHFANVWRGLWLPPPTEETRGLAPNFEAWLRQRLKKNAAYDQLVREILTAQPNAQSEANPGGFYQANQLKPENLAASVSRLFLGVKLECAQCHNHPTARWSRKQFWEFAAFFADLQAPEGKDAGPEDFHIPGTNQVVQARFLSGAVPRWMPGLSRRAVLADWMTAADNPYFARAAVNQLWAYFFGIGLVEPADDMGEHNPPSHPELLDELARDFVAHRLDLKFLVRALVGSRAYQLSSAAGDASRDDPRLFARMAVRGLSPEQLFDSLAEATEWEEPAPRPQRSFGYPDLRSPWAQFRERFANHDKRTEPQSTILQALFLMNGAFMGDALTLQGSRTLATIADAASLSTARRLETLYLVALSRKPRPEESARLVKYIDGGGPSKDPKKALADVFWALLNSAEFCLNH